jgi:hypothetical protein
MSELFPSVVLVGVSLGVASLVLALIWAAIKISGYQRQRRGY